jgi:hypothetical protein
VTIGSDKRDVAGATKIGKGNVLMPKRQGRLVSRPD